MSMSSTLDCPQCQVGNPHAAWPCIDWLHHLASGQMQMWNHISIQLSLTIARTYLLATDIDDHASQALTTLRISGASPRNNIYSLLMAAALYMKGDLSQAFRQYMHILQRSEPTKQVWWNLACMLELSGAANLHLAIAAYGQSAWLDDSDIRLAVLRITQLENLKARAARNVANNAAIRQAAPAVLQAVGSPIPVVSQPVVDPVQALQRLLERMPPAGVYIPSIAGIQADNAQLFTVQVLRHRVMLPSRITIQLTQDDVDIINQPLEDEDEGDAGSDEIGVAL